MYQIESGWVGLCRGVGRGYMGVALEVGCRRKGQVGVVGKV
jgi:hypothetical protein